MTYKKFLLLAIGMIRLIVFLMGCRAGNFNPELQISAAPPTPATSEASEANETNEAKYSNQVVTVADLAGWVEVDPAEERYDDGLCKMFWPQTPEVILVNWVTDSSAAYNVKTLRAYYADAKPLVDLKPLSKYAYNDDFFIFYAYLDHNDAPKYTLILEKDDFIYTAALITPRMSVGVGAKFEVALTERFNEEMDTFLNKIISLNLAKAGSPTGRPTKTPEGAPEAPEGEDDIAPDFVRLTTLAALKRPIAHQDDR